MHCVPFVLVTIFESRFDRRMGNACSWSGEKATRTKGTRHDAVSDTPDTLCVDEKKRYSGK